MKALVYHGPGRKAWEEAPKPTILQDGDAIIRVNARSSSPAPDRHRSVVADDRFAAEIVTTNRHKEKP
jgi:hypothetical protein